MRADGRTPDAVAVERVFTAEYGRVVAVLMRTRRAALG
jgi:hypothetical protein